MTDVTDQDELVENPTYLEHIRQFFEPVDIEHMLQMRIDLSTYEGVKAKARSIYFTTQPPNATMPKDRPKWSEGRSQTFRNWIRNGCPRGTAIPHESADFRVLFADSGNRIRHNAADIDPNGEELSLLRRAFETLMNRDHAQPDSYFAHASKHGLPFVPPYCKHHESAFNPWHRVYLKLFEDELRAVPGCERVTLPYWDIRYPPPPFLYEPPFASYTLPRDVGEGYQQGRKTQRYSANRIMTLVHRPDTDIPGAIYRALGESSWEGWNARSYRYHDNGHGVIGPTMAAAEVASFDPIFWFFHCNLDRLWLRWQQRMNATTLVAFRSTLTGPTDWLEPGFNDLEPFIETTDMTIELPIGYEHPTDELVPSLLQSMTGHISASGRFTLASTHGASVRVKGINRLNIPGTFAIHLRADGETVARQTFFQFMPRVACRTCQKNAVVDIDFEVEVEKLAGHDLSVAIELMGQERIDDWFPLSQAGDPTVNVRLLLQ